MRKTAAFFGAVALMMVGAAGPAQAAPDDGGTGAPPLHGHMLVLGVQWENGEPVGYQKCIDVAGGNALGLNAHHEHAHTGRAGMALFEAGHLFVPAYPISPFENCAALAEVFG